MRFCFFRSQKSKTRTFESFTIQNLFIAIKKREWNAVLQFFHHSPDKIQSRDYQDYQPLHHAIVQNRSDVVEQLLHYTCDVNSMTRSGMNPLSLAACNGSSAIVKLLLNHHADPNQSDLLRNKTSPLQWASLHGHFEIVVELVNAGADVDYQDRFGLTAFDYAHSLQYENMACFLNKSSEQIKSSETQSVSQALTNHEAVSILNHPTIHQILESFKQDTFQTATYFLQKCRNEAPKLFDEFVYLVLTQSKQLPRLSDRQWSVFLKQPAVQETQNPVSQCILAQLCKEGRYLSKNEKKAVAFFKEAFQTFKTKNQHELAKWCHDCIQKIKINR